MSRLINAGLRRTKFRSNLLALLLDSEPYALSVEEIRTHPLAQGPDAVTVYRNIEALMRIRLLDCVADEKGRPRYRLTETDEPKLKVTCRECHATFARSSPALSELERIARELGYSGLSPRWEISGYCGDCAERRLS